MTTTEEQRGALEREMRDLVLRSPAPLFLVRLADGRPIEVNEPLSEYLGRSREDLMAASIFERVPDPDNVARSLALLASGVIDSYTRHGRYLGADGHYRDLEVHYIGCTETPPRRTAIGHILPQGWVQSRVEAESPEEGALVIGTVDAEWRIDRISSEVHPMLDLPADSLLGRSAFTMVYPEDIGSLLLVAAHAATQGGASSGPLRVKASQDRWVWCRLSLHKLVGGDGSGFAFALREVGAPRSAHQPRAYELEEHLRRIAHEISSSGVAAMATAVPTSLELPELSELSAREYEIVVRLARGERVRMIARALFLSESTVRNHLTSVYRKLGVGSQAELVAKLQKHAPDAYGTSASRTTQTRA